MYLLNINKCRDEQIDKPLSQKESFKYLLAILLVIEILYDLDLYFPVIEIETNSFDIVNTLVSYVFLIGGLAYCYEKNGGANGSEFLSRYLSISFVVGWRVLIIFITYLIIKDIAITINAPAVQEAEQLVSEATLFNVAEFIALYFLLYWRTAHHIGLIANGDISGTELEVNQDEILR